MPRAVTTLLDERCSRRLVAACLALGLTACSDASSPAIYTVIDSAGVRIVESRDAEWGPDEGWSVASEPRLDIGGQASDQPRPFFRIVDALRLPDGRIAILDGGTSAVQVFSSEGAPVTEFGRRGDGPGELRDPRSLDLLAPDTLVVWDAGRSVATFFMDSGELVGMRRVDPARAEPGADLYPLPDGRWVVETYVTAASGGPEAEGIQRFDAPLLVLNRDGSGGDTLGLFPSSETATVSLAGRRMLGVAPFAKRTYVGVRGPSVVVGTADALAVSILSPEGDERAIYRRVGVDLTVTDADRSWYRETLSTSAPPDQRAMLRPLLDALVFPETRAAYEGLEVDARGAIWLRTGRELPPTEISPEWTVFSEDGVLLGAVTMLDRFQPFDIGADWVLGVWKDDLDVEHVRLYGVDGR